MLYKQQFDSLRQLVYRGGDPYRVLFEVLSVDNYNDVGLHNWNCKETSSTRSKIRDVTCLEMVENDTVSFLQVLHEMERQESELAFMM